MACLWRTVPLTLAVRAERLPLCVYVHVCACLCVVEDHSACNHILYTTVPGDDVVRPVLHTFRQVYCNILSFLCHAFSDIDWTVELEICLRCPQGSAVCISENRCLLCFLFLPWRPGNLRKQESKISQSQLKWGLILCYGPTDWINVFSDWLKRLSDKSRCLRSVGRWFQTLGPAALEALSPKLVHIRLTRSIRVSAERSLHGRVSVTRQHTHIQTLLVAFLLGQRRWMAAINIMSLNLSHSRN